MRRVLILAYAVMALIAAPAALPQSNRSVPVRIVTAFPTGSGPDVVTRVVADKLASLWGRPVVVDARPGGAGVPAVNSMKRSPPNGDDLVVLDVGNISINPLIFRSLGYDPDKELTPVALLYKTAFFVAAGSDGPIKSVRDMINNASKPGSLTYGSNAVGSPLHLASVQMASALGTEMVHVPYKETSQLYTAVANNEVDWAFASIASAGPLLRQGKLRFLAIADRARSAILPDVPTLEEAGGPKGVYASSWVALMAPAGTPTSVINDINRSVNEALAMPDVRERLSGFGFTAEPGPAASVADLARGEHARYVDILRRVKVTID